MICTIILASGNPRSNAPRDTSCVVRVAEVGEGVKDIEVGDLVTAECFSHCGTCHYCVTGRYNHCANRKWFSGESHGGFAEYTTAHENSVFKLSDMTFEQGALVEPLAVAHRAHRAGQKRLTRIASP